MQPPLILGLLWSGMASAQDTQGVSIDAQMVKPTFAEGTPPGVDSPVIAGKGAMRYGFFMQYERDPVILRQYDEEYGVIVRNRVGSYFGFSYDLTDRFSVRTTLPVALQVGSDTQVEAFTYEGLGLGDWAVGGRVLLAEAGPLTLGAKADVYFPIGTNNAYLGDETFRIRPGLSALVEVWRVQAAVDAAYTARPRTVDTGLDLNVESTIDINAGASMEVWPDVLALQVGWMYWGGVQHFAQGGGENASEVIGGLRILTENGRVDLGVGKGLADGPGTTAFRGFVGYTWVRPPTAPVVEPEPVVIEDPPPEPDPVVVVIEEIPEDDEWEPEEEARIVGDVVQIRDPIQFEFNTANILEESDSTLVALAQIMHDNAEIETLVIEGHASIEGDYDYNWELSNARAQAIWKVLLEQGVHPSRVSYRSMGEVVTKTEGDDEASLADNRRVEFQITSRIEEGEDYPAYPESYLLPWSGEQVDTVQPTQAVPEEEEPKTLEEQLDELLNPDAFEPPEDDEPAEGAPDDDAPAPEETPEDSP
jgi:outer membrane protein OmpA-like peptidoglycan-associated protein